MKKIIKSKGEEKKSFILTKIKFNQEKETNLNSNNSTDSDKINFLVDPQDQQNIIRKKDIIINPYYIELNSDRKGENIEDNYEIEKGIIKKKLSFTKNNNKYCFGKQNFSRNLNYNKSEKIHIKNLEQINNNSIEVSDSIKKHKLSSFTQNKNSCKLSSSKYLSKETIKVPTHRLSVSNYQLKKNLNKMNNLYSHLNLFPKIKKDNYNNISNSTKENKSIILKNNNYINQINSIRKINQTKLFQPSNSNSLYSISTMPYKISNNNSSSNRSLLYKKLKNIINRNKKYPFIYNPNTVCVNKNVGLLPSVKKFNSKCVKLLKKENSKLFNQYFSIVNENKFSNKFRDPLNNPMDRDIKIKEKKTRSKSKNVKTVNILKQGNELFELLNQEILKERKLMYNNKYRKLSKKSFNQKLKKIIIKNCIYIKKHLIVTLKEILISYKFSYVSLSCSKTQKLIDAIKNKNYNLCCYIIDKYKNTILDFDYFHMTPLHYVAKNNFYQIVPKIAEYGGLVDFQNFVGDTALHICSKKKYYETMALLLLYVASPFIKNNKGKKAIECSDDLRVGLILKKIEDIHFKHFFTKSKLFYESVQKEFLDFILKEFNTQIEPEALELFKTKAFLIW